MDEAGPPNGILRSRTGLHRVGSLLESGVASDASTWIVPVTSYFTVPWREVYGIPDAAGRPALFMHWDENFQVLQLSKIDGEGRSANLTVELVDTEPRTIEFRDQTTRKLIYVMPARPLGSGWSSEAMLRAVRGWGAEEVDFIVGRPDPVLGDQRILVQAPWERGEVWENDVVTVGGRFYTLTSPPGERYSLAGIHLWESADGISWSQATPPPVSGSLNVAWLTAGHDRLMLHVDDGRDRILVIDGWSDLGRRARRRRGCTGWDAHRHRHRLADAVLSQSIRGVGRWRDVVSGRLPADTRRGVGLVRPWQVLRRPGVAGRRVRHLGRHDGALIRVPQAPIRTTHRPRADPARMPSRAVSSVSSVTSVP